MRSTVKDYFKLELLGASKKAKGNFFENRVRQLLLEDFNVSMTNCFINGFKYENDLLILHEGVNSGKILYELEEVFCVIELKGAGVTDVRRTLPKFDEEIVFLENNFIDFIIIALRETPYYKTKYLSKYYNINRFFNYYWKLNRKKDREKYKDKMFEVEGADAPLAPNDTHDVIVNRIKKGNTM